MEIKKIGVVGAGTMGNGIALVAAQIGCEVVMRDIKDEFVDRGMKTITKFLSKSVEKGKLDEAKKDSCFAFVVKLIRWEANTVFLFL